MLELMLCSMLTVLPDYLFRRYVQGKRIGREITLYTMWYELRWGITACLLLTVSLITLIFYFHPSTKNVTAIFRTVTILPERGGRVAEVFVNLNDKVEAGAPLFRLDSSEQEAALETARRQIAEIEAETAVAQTELAAADGQIKQAQGAHLQAVDELETKTELRQRNPNVVALREIERLQVAVDGRQGAVDAAFANKQTLETRIASLLPAQKASAEAALAAGAGRAGQDRRARRRRRDGPAVHAAGGRRRQSDVAARRHPRSRRSGAGRAYRRLRADRGAGDEGRHDRRGHLRRRNPSPSFRWS